MGLDYSRKEGTYDTCSTVNFCREATNGPCHFAFRKVIREATMRLAIPSPCERAQGPERGSLTLKYTAYFDDFTGKPKLGVKASIGQIA